jgi:uncharacterized protein YecE (DUF72 family)
MPRNNPVDCSGWQYTPCCGDFYPAELPISRWFAHYSLIFDTVEINNSFYRLPPAETLAKWREVKASRFLTLARSFENARQLEPRLGPILYQLPPQWPINPAARPAGLTTRLHRSSYTRSSYQFGFNNDTRARAARRGAIRAKDHWYNRAACQCPRISHLHQRSMTFAGSSNGLPMMPMRSSRR